MSTFIRTCRCRHSFAVSTYTMRSTLVCALRWFTTERLLESKWVLIFSGSTNMVERVWLLYMLRHLLCFHTANDWWVRSLTLIDHINVIEIRRKVVYNNHWCHSTLSRYLMIYLCDFLLQAHHIMFNCWFLFDVRSDKLSTTWFSLLVQIICFLYFNLFI